MNLYGTSRLFICAEDSGSSQANTFNCKRWHLDKANETTKDHCQHIMDMCTDGSVTTSPAPVAAVDDGTKPPCYRGVLTFPEDYFSANASIANQIAQPFVLQDIGRCPGAPGPGYVASKHSCEMAAVKLGLGDTIATEVMIEEPGNAHLRPRGCYWKGSNPRADRRLFFNGHPNPSSTAEGQSERQSICGSEGVFAFTNHTMTHTQYRCLPINTGSAWITKYPPAELAALMFSFGFSWFPFAMAPVTLHRVMTSKDVDSVRWAFTVLHMFPIVFFMPMLLLGWTAGAMWPEDTTSAMPLVAFKLAEESGFGAFVSILCLVSCIASFMSTADSLVRKNAAV